MIDSGDHVNAKQLADSLPDDVKHFIPKDAWKQMHEQDQIETNGVKVEEKKDKIKKSQMNIFEKSKQFISNIFNKAKDIVSINEPIIEDIYNEFTDTIVFNSNFDILLLKRNVNTKIEPGKWWLPGGHREYKEEPILSAYRELTEETGLGDKMMELIQVDRIKQQNKTFYYFTTLIPNNENVIIDLDEHSDIMWMSYDTLFDDNQKDIIAFKQVERLRELVTKARQIMSYCVLKQAFKQNKISEDKFLSVLASRTS